MMLPDGCLMHKGRKDFRVKIRGYAVEAAEVEREILTNPSIRETVVVTKASESGEARLIAYCTLSNASLTVGELRSFLRQGLPEYMIPSTFVILDAMPLAPTGKLDRRALPDPDRARPELNTSYVAPRTSVELELEAIWREVLSLNRVGVYDNFFELGGHSLAATRIVSQIINRFRLEFSLQSLFQFPTVAEMAATITYKQSRTVAERDLGLILNEIESLTDEQARKVITRMVGGGVEGRKK
jgi:acyl carrier protein